MRVRRFGWLVDLVEITLRLVGAFYVWAGFIATRVALTSHWIDIAIAAISFEKPTLVARLQAAWMLFGSTLVLAGGLALLLLLDFSRWLFVASSIQQFAYLGYVAPNFFDQEDPPDPEGRRQTISAYVIYLIATLLVLWAYDAGRLVKWQEVHSVALGAAAAVLLANILYIFWILFKQTRSDDSV